MELDFNRADFWVGLMAGGFPGLIVGLMIGVTIRDVIDGNKPSKISLVNLLPKTSATTFLKVFIGVTLTLLFILLTLIDAVSTSYEVNDILYFIIVGIAGGLFGFDAIKK